MQKGFIQTLKVDLFFHFNFLPMLIMIFQKYDAHMNVRPWHYYTQRDAIYHTLLLINRIDSMDIFYAIPLGSDSHLLWQQLYRIAHNLIRNWGKVSCLFWCQWWVAHLVDDMTWINSIFFYFVKLFILGKWFFRLDRQSTTFIHVYETRTQ